MIGRLSRKQGSSVVIRNYYFFDFMYQCVNVQLLNKINI